ncbi:MAG: hypothetical protein EHM14_14180 [Methanothrix sp.]|nr:MAG: hypothetical protein EHM14_14180 [Methanothrix sp.]
MNFVWVPNDAVVRIRRRPLHLASHPPSAAGRARGRVGTAGRSRACALPRTWACGRAGAAR